MLFIPLVRSAQASKQKQCIRMYQALETCKTGLKNLQQTYRDDTTMHAQIQLVMDEIDDFISIVGMQTYLQFLSLCPSPKSDVSQLSE